MARQGAAALMVIGVCLILLGVWEGMGHDARSMAECRQWASVQSCLCWIRHECDPAYFGEGDTDG